MLALVKFAPFQANAQEKAFIESNGQIIIQAESVALNGDWVSESSDAGYTGNGYIRWNGPDLFGTPGTGTLAYRVFISEPGDYNVRFRMSHLGAPAGDRWNDCWTRMDSGTWVKTLHPAGRMNEGFTFHSPTEPSGGVFSQMRYNLTAGEHTLYISGRSSNLRIDRIHFYKDGTPDPLNLAKAESAYQVVDGGTDDGDETEEEEKTDEEEEVQTPAVTVTGAFKKWHPVTLSLDGLPASENGATNPFLDYRLDVTFSQGTRKFIVPGYFAADGNAAESSADSGDVWLAHFIPDSTGVWDFSVSMRTGTNIAVDDNPETGTPVVLEGATGAFSIADTDKSGKDHRAKGVLRYTGEHYLRFDNGDYFLKGGANSPENFLAYADFDSTYNAGGTDFVKSYAAHVADWQPGDPVWQQDKGKGIIGALNYLSAEGMNVVYFMTMNLEGDGQDVWPWTSPAERIRFDVSKLAQWNVVFNHMDSAGLMLHMVLQETENEKLLDGGALGVQRKLYFRELVARFAHHHALTWNLGEENDENTDTQRKAFASYIRALDPYDHPIVIHTYPGQWDDVYTNLLGYEDFEGASLQINGFEDIREQTLKWRTLSAETPRPWVVSLDEIGPYQTGVLQDGINSNHDEVRKKALWPHLMAGGAGVEWYFGYDSENHDLNAEDWRTRDTMWDYTRFALAFFQEHLPFHEMAPMDSLIAGENAYVLADTGHVYAAYMPAADSVHLQIGHGTYTTQWYNPRTGGDLLVTAQDTVTGPGLLSAAPPVLDSSEDWVMLVRNIDPPEDTDPPEIIDDGTPAITELNLVDAASDTVLYNLNVGSTLDLAALPPHLNVSATVRNTGDFEIAYVELHLTPPYVIRKETIAPYALFGDTGGDYLHGTFSQGVNSVMAVPFYYDGGVLTEGEAMTVNMQVTGFNPATRITAAHAAKAPDETREPPERATSDMHTFALEANYPNPFNPSTLIAFSLPDPRQVRLTVYDILGREVRVLVDGPLAAGRHEVLFDAASLPAGAYLYKLDAGGQSQTRKMLLLR